MRGLPVAIIVVPVIISVAVMMFFAHFPWMILVVLAIWLVWNIIKWRIESAVGRRKEDIATIEEQHNEIVRLRDRVVDERIKSSNSSNEDINRRRKLMELEEILNRGKKQA